MTDVAEDQAARETGPALTFEGVIVIEWGKPRPGARSVEPLPAWKTAIFDALSGKPITTVSKLEIHAPANGLVTADLTMFADQDGQPVYSGNTVYPGGDGEILTGTWPFLVAEMRVCQPASARAALEPKFLEPEPAEA